MADAKSGATAVQPPPVKNDRPFIVDIVVSDLRETGFDDLAAALIERKQFGIQKYGTALQAFNDRHPLVDAYQEALDGILYARQAAEEAEEHMRSLHAGSEPWFEALRRIELMIDVETKFIDAAETLRKLQLPSGILS